MDKGTPDNSSNEATDALAAALEKLGKGAGKEESLGALDFALRKMKTESVDPVALETVTNAVNRIKIGQGTFANPRIVCYWRATE